MTDSTPKPNPTPAADESAPLLLLAVALGALLAIFLWVYARFAGALYFGMDDYIETEYALAKPLGAVIADAFSGTLSWSGYRPVAYSLRAVMAHLFGAQQVAGYYVVGMGVHLLNTLLTFHIVWRVARRVIPAFLAAAFFLLLPAHNEAVLYMSANANLLALLFALLALEAGSTFALAESRARILSTPVVWALIGATAVAYLLAVLTYEVTLPIILLLLLADWRITTANGSTSWRSFVQRRTALYAALALAAAIALIMRYWAGGVAMERTDYGVSLAPAHLLKGYSQLLSQVALLFNSPWKHLPDYGYNREWMAVTNPRALASILLVGAATAGTLWLALRRPFESIRPRALLFWLGWGALWVLAIGLPFVMLAGRDPENRYTYIPSFGASVAVGALFLGLFGWVARQHWKTTGNLLLVGIAAVWLGVYGWVTTSDVAEFARAGAHARAFLQMVETQPLQDAQQVAQVGVPYDVGSAYVFATDEAFEAAMRLHGVPAATELISGDLALASMPQQMPGIATDTKLLGYDRATHTAAPIATSLFCNTALDDLHCRVVQYAPGENAGFERWVYIQMYNTEDPESGGIGMLVADSTLDLSGSHAEDDYPVVRSCWHFIDHNRVQVNPASFNNAAVAAKCQASFAALLPQLTALLPDPP